MTDKLKAAAQQALEALETCVTTCFDRYAHEQVMSRPEHFVNQTLTALRTALAEQPAEQEPVAYIHTPSVLMEGVVRPVVSFEKYEDDYNSGIYSVRIPLYTHPQPDDTALLRQALEALEEDWDGCVNTGQGEAIIALRERLGETK